MRKVKVAAAIFCLMTAGFLGGIAVNGNDVSVAHTDQSGQLLELTAETVTTAASIETTAIVTTGTTEAKTTVTTTATTSAATAATTTAVTTVQTSAPQTTVAETEPVTEETTVTELTEEVVFLAPPPVTDVPVITLPPQTEPAPETAPPATEPAVQETAPASAAITVTDSEYIMLCNVVGHEYGADWIPAEEKALVAEVIMNRVNSPLFPNTVYDVLMQPNQFPGLRSLIESGTMSRYVTQGVRDAVDLYLAHPEQFQHGYLYFNGDGQRNYFRTGY